MTTEVAKKLSKLGLVLNSSIGLHHFAPVECVAYQCFKVVARLQNDIPSTWRKQEACFRHWRKCTFALKKGERTHTLNSEGGKKKKKKLLEQVITQIGQCKRWVLISIDLQNTIVYLKYVKYSRVQCYYTRAVGYADARIQI